MSWLHRCTSPSLSLRAAASAGALLFTGLLASPVTAAEPVRLTVDAGAPGTPISPLLYGVFFEEINHAGDGGLYAELVRNRGLEDRADTPESWSLVADGGGEGRISLDTAQPVSASSPHSLRLDIVRPGGVGVANGGYWGMAIRQGARYRYNLRARRSSEYSGALTVALVDSAGRTLAEAKTGTLETGWKRFEGTLTAHGSDPGARLIVRAAGSTPGTIWLDVVSVFPQDTYKGRSNGLRKDLAEMVAGLKPAFIRFPGGCFVEGDTLKDAWRWKETLGDIADRPGRGNLWGYRSTDGLGYHEYLQMCEDMRAEPLFVINCGMSHKGNVPMDQLEPWVQDALDAIEYANGPASSKWGALRAKHGHPKPFGLKYLEVGNENGGPAYNERYALFYDAVRAKYPDIKIIANDWGGMPRSRPVELLDQHAYNSPDWFASRAYQFDGLDRKTHPKIYFGEYAATRNAGLGNLRAAVGEAAFMTGFERNADLVHMASYAPLFVHVQNRAWNPDAIGFDASRSYGTPSYYVQQMFAQNQGDVSLPVRVTAPAVAAVAPKGAIGVGTWRTQAEYKDIRVTDADGKTLFSEDFATAGAAAWRPVRGEWSVQQGIYRQKSEAEDVRAIAGDPSWSGDLTYSLKARKIAGAEGFLILFQVRGDGDWIWWNLGGWNNTQHGLEKSEGDSKDELAPRVSGSIETGRWYDIRIELRGNRIRCFLDNKLIQEVEDKPRQPITASVNRITKTGEIILKVVNFSDTPQETEITLERLVTPLQPTGTETVLTSAKPTDENTLDAPTRVAPVTRPVSGLTPTFRHAFPPYSVTVLRLKAKK